MTAIETFCKELKNKYTPKKISHKEPVSCWSEPDRFNDQIIKAFVIILRTRGCSWSASSGCTMCGYFNDSSLKEISDEDLIAQYHSAMKKYNDEPVVKIFNSGSFFDEDEVSTTVRDTIFKDLSSKTQKIAVESRPEYITKSSLNAVSDFFSETLLEIGIGLETADDAIRNESINKGFTFADYKQSAKLLHSYHHLIKTYVLQKPPFLTEKDSIDDCVSTIKKVKDITDTISINPTNIQKFTLVEYLWRRKQYRPPWLWSVIDVITKASAITSKRLQCDIVAGGKMRGPHNCFTCDKKELHAIQSFSLSQDVHLFDEVSCDCRDNWLDQLEIEPLSFGSIIDIPTS